MAKHKIKLERTFTGPLRVAFEVEFDPETGEAEVVSPGRVVSHPDHLTRREILQSIDLDRIFSYGYSFLI